MQLVIDGHAFHRIRRMFGVAAESSDWIENCQMCQNKGIQKRFWIEFRSPDLRNILVATDVAARGLDLKHVSVVVSLQPSGACAEHGFF